MSLNNGMFTSNSAEWATPWSLFELINSVYNFTLDVCANEHNTKVPNNFYSIKDNGLVLDWSGTCWCNPPYGREIDQWVRKALRESEKDIDSIIVMLLPARTDTKWMHDYVFNFADLLFLKGRVKFNNMDAAPFPSMLAIYNDIDHRGEQLSHILPGLYVRRD